MIFDTHPESAPLSANQNSQQSMRVNIPGDCWHTFYTQRHVNHNEYPRLSLTLGFMEDVQMLVVFSLYHPRRIVRTVDTCTRL